MARSKVVICGLARNVEHILQTNIQRVEKLASLFCYYAVTVYENDSTDATPELLQAWSRANPRVLAVSVDRGDPVNPGTRCLDRATRMATYRNELRRRILAEKQTKWASHIIVIDLDLPGGWSYDGIASSFGVPTETWDFMGSNGLLLRDYGGKSNVLVYFDVWAFRPHGSDAPQRPEVINPKRWRRGEDLVPVNSCFGGLGIYRSQAFERCSYDGSDCEHVPFHRKMREAGMGRIFMNPSQITLYSSP